jgi:hypothetical protein
MLLKLHQQQTADNKNGRHMQTTVRNHEQKRDIEPKHTTLKK